MPDAVLAWIAFLSFNVPIFCFLAAVPFAKRLKQALKEKSPTGDSTNSASYSRVTGALGAVMLTSFFWGIGNIVLADALLPGGANQIRPLVDAVERFFAIGCAMFLPYAVNQLKTLFPWGANAAVAAAKAQSTTAAATQTTLPAMAVTVVNMSSTIDDTRLQHAVDAIGRQVREDFAGEWGMSASLSVVHAAMPPTMSTLATTPDAVIYVGDKSDDPNTGVGPVFGYHAANNAGVAYGFVYLDVCAAYQEGWTVTLSHEVLELLADPCAVITVTDPNQPQLSFSREVCDPVQGDTYPIDGVDLANFVNRAFYGEPGGSKAINHLGLAQQPFTPRPAGYVTYSDGKALQQRWGGKVTASQRDARAMLGKGRRNARREARGVL